MGQLMVSVSGVRGIVGDGLRPDIVAGFAQAFGTFCQGGTVVLGRDSRVSGDMMYHAVVAGLLSVGCKIIDIGVCPTPTTQLATEKHQAAGGLMLTASHNPVMWNGIKMLAADGLFLDAEQGEAVLRIRQSDRFEFKTWQQLGSLEQDLSALQDHLHEVLSVPFLHLEQIRARKFKVVADCINGAGCEIVPRLLEELGCDIVVLNGTPDGRFVRAPEPLPENLTAVCEAVKKYGADLAVVVDPDADRLALVSDRGVPLGEEYTLAIATDFVLGRRRGPVAVNVSTSRVIDDIAAKYDCPVHRTRVGEINVAKRMREIGAVIGGEGNGGVILPDVHLGRDSLVGIGLVLQRLAEANTSLHALHRSLPQYRMVKMKIELPAGVDPAAVVAALREKYAGEQLDETDGVKILRAKSWVQVRPSNTEPILRVMSEAPTEAEARTLANELSAATEHLVG